jgi:hypothetical protein
MGEDMEHLVLFVHLFGVGLLITGVAFSIGGLVVAQRAVDVAGVRAAVGLAPYAERLIGPAQLLILGAGLYLVSQRDSSQGPVWTSSWLLASYVIFGVMSIIGPGIESKRVAKLHEAVKEVPDGPIPAEIDRMRRDPVLSHVATFGGCQIAVFLYLMSNRPGTTDTLIATLAATAASLLLARLTLRAPAAAPAAIPAQAGAATESAAP